MVTLQTRPARRDTDRGDAPRPAAAGDDARGHDAQERDAGGHDTGGHDSREHDSRGKIAAAGLVAVGIVLVALNLRPAIISLGALLAQVRAGLHLSGTVAGLITALPVLCFAAFGAVTPRLARRFGAHALLAGAVGLLAVGLALRALTGSTVVFLVTSALALAGIAIGNILLPVLVKQHFPHRVGLLTGVYTMTLTAGTAVAAAVAVPAAHALGGWREGLGLWALVAAVAVVPWVLIARRHRPSTGPTQAGPAARIRPARTRIGWALALFFGAQSLTAYVIMGWLPALYHDAGFSPAVAGLLTAAIMAIGVPVAIVLPAFAARRADQRAIVLVLAAFSATGYLGLLLAPHAGALLWTVLLALGQGAFPLVLAMIGMRARTAAGTVALSAFTQSTGYLITALGPLLVGVLREATGDWTAPLVLLMGVVVVQGMAGMAAARPRYIDE